jgi:hypothetical protein
MEGSVLRVFADWETYFDHIYTLKFLSPAEYILDHRFEMLGCGIAIDNGPPKFMPREESITFLRSINEPYALISHNALFDAVICALRYDLHPDVLIDTMGMVRALLAYKIPSGRVSLKAVLDFLELETKGDVIHEMSGVHFDAIQHVPDLWIRFLAYTLRDVRGCREVFNYLAPSFPPGEARIMDMVIRMATQPRLLINEHILTTHLYEIEKKKNSLLKDIGLDKAYYMSNQKFAEVLRQLGVNPPMRISAATGKPTYAFAKTNEEFMDLQNHPDERVQAVMAARLGVKTTIEESRTRRFLAISKAAKATFDKGWMPVPLKYSGAHTHRLSGDWALNMQNLSSRKNTRLRSALYAPPGYVIVAVDASQIEARLTAWLANETSLLTQFRNKVDVYRQYAADEVYHVPVDQVTKLQRFNCKTIILGLGFGMSDEKFYFTITNAAREAGFDVTYTMEECTGWVNRYRNKFQAIKALWNRATRLLAKMEQGRADGMSIGPCVADGLSIVLPSGLRLNYDQLTYHAAQGGDEWDTFTYQFGRTKREIYGAKLIENIVQALDRQHVLEAALRTEDRCAAAGLPGIKLTLQEHDANAYVVSSEIYRYVAKVAYEEMCRPSWWGVDKIAGAIPLAAEAKFGLTYGELREFTWR